MTGKFDSTLLSVGNDISEVRNALPSIFHYLDIESVRLDLVEKILIGMKEMEIEKQSKYKEPEKLNISIPAIEIKDSPTEKIKLSLLKQLEVFTANKVGIAFLVNFIYPKLKQPLEELVRILNEQPIKVNLTHVLLIEFIFAMSNHKPVEYNFKLVDGKINFESDKEDKFERISLLDFSDLQRQNEVNLDMVTNLLTDIESLNIHSYNIFTENTLSTNAKYPLYFAFTLSQCSIFKIKEFLDFQKSLFEGDFNEFLEISLLKYQNLFKEEQLFVINNWINKKQSTNTLKSNDRNKNTDIHLTIISVQKILFIKSYQNV